MGYGLRPYPGDALRATPRLRNTTHDSMPQPARGNIGAALVLPAERFWYAFAPVAMQEHQQVATSTPSAQPDADASILSQVIRLERDLLAARAEAQQQAEATIAEARAHAQHARKEMETALRAQIDDIHKQADAQVAQVQEQYQHTSRKRLETCRREAGAKQDDVLAAVFALVLPT